jgi:hypothetical protein
MKKLIISAASSALALFASAPNWQAGAASARCVVGCSLVCNKVRDEKHDGM